MVVLIKHARFKTIDFPRRLSEAHLSQYKYNRARAALAAQRSREQTTALRLWKVSPMGGLPNDRGGASTVDVFHIIIASDFLLCPCQSESCYYEK